MNYKAIFYILTFAMAGSRAYADDPVRITTQGTKPMMEICDKISDLFHWRVSYEDPPVLDRSELVLGTAPSGVTWYKIRAVPVSFEVPAMQGESLKEYRRKVMNAAVTAYVRSGNRAGFRYTDDGEYIHVEPVAVAGPDGRVGHYESLLSTSVTIERGRYTINAMLMLILAQIGERSGVTIELGAMPQSFNQVSLMEEADNESARNVIARVFNEHDGRQVLAGAREQHFFWSLTYAANGSRFFFAVDAVPAALNESEIAYRSRHANKRNESAPRDQGPNRATSSDFSSGAAGNKAQPPAK